MGNRIPTDRICTHVQPPAHRQSRVYRPANVIRVPQRHLTRYYAKNVDAAARADKDIGIIVSADSSAVSVYVLSLQLFLQFHPSQLSGKETARQFGNSLPRKRARSDAPNYSPRESHSRLPLANPFRSSSQYHYEVPGQSHRTRAREFSLNDEKKRSCTAEDGVHLMPPPGNPEPCYRYKQPALASLSSSSFLPRQLQRHLSLYYKRLRSDKSDPADSETQLFSIVDESGRLQMPELSPVSDAGSGVSSEYSSKFVRLKGSPISRKVPRLSRNQLEVVTVFGSGTVHDL